MEMTGAEAILASLKEEQVPVVFGYPGGAVLGLYDAIYRTGFPHILTGHEQGAVHAADGYARATGKVGVCIATSGPGVCNMVTGIATANMDSIPLVIISGQVATSLIGQDAFQEADTAGITTPITKYNYLVRKVENLPQVLKEAFYIARTGRPGPVLIDIVTDVFDARLDFHYPKEVHLLGYQGSQHPRRADVQRAAEALRRARRPVIMAGGGVVLSDTGGELTRLAEKTGIPVVTTLMGKGAVPDTLPQHLGMLGMHGCYTSNRAVAECDVLIAVGTRFSDRVALNPKTFAKNATIIQIDIDASELGKNVDVDLSIVGDAAYVLNAMLPQIKPAKHPEWMTMIQSWQAQDYHPVSDPTRLMPHQVIGEVCNQCGPDAVYVTDVGQHQMWAAQYLRHTKSRGFITSGGLGTMGFGYGAAIGAQMALGRQQRVVMFTGDGSFHMNLNEACTAVSYELPIITVIFNNSVLGMVRQWQTTFYGKRYSQTDPHRKTDFVKLADGFGLKGYRCTNLPAFQEAFADALQQKGPTWIECIIDKDEKVLPMIPGGGDINDIIME